MDQTRLARTDIGTSERANGISARFCEYVQDMTNRLGRRDLLFWVPRAALLLGAIEWAAIAVRAASEDEIHVSAFVTFAAVAIATLPVVVLISLRPSATARRLRQRPSLPESALMFTALPIFLSGSALQDAVGASLHTGGWILLVGTALVCGAIGSLVVLRAYDAVAQAETRVPAGN